MALAERPRTMLVKAVDDDAGAEDMVACVQGCRGQVSVIGVMHK